MAPFRLSLELMLRRVFGRAITGLKNPILLAGKVAELGEMEEGVDGRIHPWHVTNS